MSEKTLVERWRKQLQDVGGWDNELAGVPAGGVRKMIEEFELALTQAQARLEESDTALRIRSTECLMQSQRAEQAQARCAELEKDAARLDWLIDNCPYLPLNGGVHLPENSRAAIDAALKEQR